MYSPVSSHAPYVYSAGGVMMCGSRSDCNLLTFLTIANYKEALEQNVNGLVTIFHAKYCVKSQKVIEMFK